MNEKPDFLKTCKDLLYDYIDPFEVPGAVEAIKKALRSADLSDLVRECEPNECLAYLQWKNSLTESRWISATERKRQ